MFFAIFRSEGRSITDRSQSTLLTEYKKQQNRFSRHHDKIFRNLLLEDVSIFYKKTFNHPIPQEINALCNNKTTQLDQLALKIKKILGTSFIKRPDAVIKTLSFDTCQLSFLRGGKKLLSHISKIQKSETNKDIFLRSRIYITYTTHFLRKLHKNSPRSSHLLWRSNTSYR